MEGDDHNTKTDGDEEARQRKLDKACRAKLVALRSITRTISDQDVPSQKKEVIKQDDEDDAILRKEIEEDMDLFLDPEL